VQMVTSKSRGFITSAAALLGLCAAFLLGANARAAEIEPRKYSNAPVGMNFLILGYAYTDGALSTDPASPLQDAKLKIDTEIFAYARSLSLWGRSAKIDLVVPYSQLSGTATFKGETVAREVSGFNDPRLRLSVCLTGAPALSAQQFASYKQDVIVGASVQVSAPFGQYDPDRLVNLGNNRWFIRPDIGISKAVGNFTLELTGSAYIYTTNHDFYGGQTVEQDPVYETQAHVTYSFGRGLWAAGDVAYDFGGRKTIDGVREDETLSNWRYGGTLAIPVNRNNSIKFTGSTGTAKRGTASYDLLGAAWQVRW
jgi:hypothetical protein